MEADVRLTKAVLLTIGLYVDQMVFFILCFQLQKCLGILPRVGVLSQRGSPFLKQVRNVRSVLVVTFLLLSLHVIMEPVGRVINSPSS